MQSSFKRSHVFASLKAATKNVTNRRQVGKELSRELQCAKTEVKYVSSWATPQHEKMLFYLRKHSGNAKTQWNRVDFEVTEPLKTL